MSSRLREQYTVIDMNWEITWVTFLLGVNSWVCNTLINIAVYILAIQATFRGEMTWGMFGAFQTYLRMVQAKLDSSFTLVIRFRKHWAVLSNLVEMMRTPVAIETYAKLEEFQGRALTPAF